MNVPTEYILNMGYYPDTHAAHGLPVDTLFIHVYFDASWVKLFEHAWRNRTHENKGGTAEQQRIIRHYFHTLEDAAVSLQWACREKYKLKVLPPWDTFWSVSPKPDWSPT